MKRKTWKVFYHQHSSIHKTPTRVPYQAHHRQSSSKFEKIIIIIRHLNIIPPHSTPHTPTITINVQQKSSQTHSQKTSLKITINYEPRVVKICLARNAKLGYSLTCSFHQHKGNLASSFKFIA